MKNAFLIFFAHLLFSFTGFSQIFIDSNADLIFDGDVDFTLVETDLQVDGVFTAGDGTILFKETAGGLDPTISGLATITLNNVILDLQNQDLTLMNDIAVNGDFTFQNGHCDLNGNDVNLGADGMVMGENDSHSFFGVLGGDIVKTITLNAPTSVNPGNLGAIITSTADLGNTTIRRGHEVQTSGGGMSIARYYDISPANNSGLNATLRFHYLDDELGSIPENELELWRKSGGVWQKMGFTSRNTTTNYIELTSIDAFSIWTATNDANALPVELSYFNVTKVNETAALLQWETASENNNLGFEIQRAVSNTNALNLQWHNLGFIEGNGTTSASHQYEYLDANPREGYHYYKLRQIDLDGKESYSEVKVLLFEKEKTFMVGALFPNPSLIGNEEISLPVNFSSAGDLQIHIFDNYRRVVHKSNHELPSGSHLITLDVSRLPVGIYSVLIYGNKETTSQRFVVVD